ncbi:MAG TPA: DNA polymerase III subunit gamma/tau [Rhodospirillaceae bacterium]|nr:DNA polymerase III subunit gamma/tau [Rhodospirillaceae bacterium]
MSEKQLPYRVLARKYRPRNFDELIGQDALVRTLTNAIQSGRVAHAFMLTGVRGVGKTTTARIIAKALNYTGPDGKAGPTAGPTDDCQLCRAIAEDRHPDVMEMDAATRTGVDDIREILDGVRYAPSEARYKVYIIDEVHMLSKQAFNALLKTLEEPPEHVKFIFATTEIRKVPVTVLSRCQRFDLRRVDEETLSMHYRKICGLEKVGAEDEAISMIARAADGSVRDGLSLLDQAIALANGEITAAQVGAMLGLADRAKSMDLLERALTGDMPGALALMEDFHRNGADPAVVIQDLLDLTHVLTRLRAVPEAGEMKQSLSADMIRRAKDLAGKLSMPTLGKSWQLLLKGLGEVNIAPSPQTAAEMVIIRLVYAADLPDPADLIKKLKDQPVSNQGASPSSSYAPPRETAPMARGSAAAAPVQVSAPHTETYSERAVHSLEDIVALLQEGNEYLLAGQVAQFVHLVKLEQGKLEINLEPEAPLRLSQDISQRLSALSGRRWMVSVSGAKGAPTLAQQEKARQQKEFEDVLKLPAIRDILEVFPDAKITGVKNKG